MGFWEGGMLGQKEGSGEKILSWVLIMNNIS